MLNLPKGTYDPASGESENDIDVVAINAETVIEEMINPQIKGKKETQKGEQRISLIEGEEVVIIPSSDYEIEGNKEQIETNDNQNIK